ncbi:hypothetical protein D3C85_699340 [compost metagenome]
MLADDVLGNGQAQPGTVRTTADHGEENGFLKFCRDARTVIDDLDLGHQAMAHMADGELAHGAGAQADATQAQFVLAADGLHCVAHDVQHGLDHLLAVDQDIGDARVVVAHQRDATLAFRFHQAADALQHLMHVAHRQ